MLYLAQAEKDEFSPTVNLKLLAQEEFENTWTLINKEKLISPPHSNFLIPGLLVLVEISDQQEVLSIQDARDWVLDLVQKYLTTGITPAFLVQEAEKAEQWRQELTLQSQELGRKTLEIEARREQLQQLQEELKRKEEELAEIENHQNQE